MKDLCFSGCYELSLSRLHELQQQRLQEEAQGNLTFKAVTHPMSTIYDDFTLNDQMLDALIICGEALITYRDFQVTINDTGLWVLAYGDAPVFIGRVES